MPLNGIDELIIDPVTGLPINNSPYDTGNVGGDTGWGNIIAPQPVIDSVTPTIIQTPDNQFIDSATGQPVNPYTGQPTTQSPGVQDTAGGVGGQPTSQVGGGTPAPGQGGSIPTVPWTPTGGNGTTITTPGTFQQAPFPTGVGGNYQQVQNAVQGGQFATQGQTNQAQLQQSGQQQNQTQTGQQQQTVNTSQTTAPVDTLGFGALLKDQAGSVGQTDAARQAFLQDIMGTGGTAFQSQMDQAIRNSLTGPQVTGAGDSARARIGGYAAAETGRNNLNQRLAAAEQLGGPTGLATLSTAANPFVGSQTSGTQQSLTDSLQNLASNTSGWQSLLGQTNETQSGATAAQSSQAGAGNIPEGQPVKTGGCVLCTAAIELGLFRNKRVLREAIDYKLGKGWKKFRLAARGYWAVFGPFADWLLDHPRIARTLYPMARMVVYEELRQAGRKLPFRAGAWLVHWIGDTFCRLVGLFPVAGHVTQPRINAIARRENIIFNVRN